MMKPKGFNHAFAPTPMEYMRGKFGQAKRNLAMATEQAVALAATPSHMIDPTLESSELQTLHDAELDIETNDGSEYTLEDSMYSADDAFLPLFSNSSQPKNLESTSVRSQLIVQRPFTVLALVMIAFLISTTSLLSLDRFNLYQATYKFPYPLTLLLFQTVFCEAALLILVILSKLLSLVRPGWANHLGIMRHISLGASEFRRFAPLSVSYLASGAALISFLEYVPMNVALLCLTPVMVIQLGLTKAFWPERSQTIVTAGSCVTLMVGYALSTINNTFQPLSMSLHASAMVAGMLAAIALPVQHCVMKKALTKYEGNPLQLFHHVLLSTIGMLLLALFLSGEAFDISANCFFLDEPGFWLMVLVLCLVSVLACYSQFLLQMFTTPVTLTVLFFAKTSIIQIPFMSWLHREQVHWINLLGILLSVLGTLGYFQQLRHKATFPSGHRLAPW